MRGLKVEAKIVAVYRFEEVQAAGNGIVETAVVELGSDLHVLFCSDVAEPLDPGDVGFVADLGLEVVAVDTGHVF